MVVILREVAQELLLIKFSAVVMSKDVVLVEKNEGRLSLVPFNVVFGCFCLKRALVSQRLLRDHRALFND